MAMQTQLIKESDTREMIKKKVVEAVLSQGYKEVVAVGMVPD